MATSKTTDVSAKKTSAKKAAPKTDTPKTKSASPRKKSVKPSIITSEERYKMIEVAAYFIAEKNGFGDSHMDYWLQAEKEIDHKLNA